VLSLASLQCPVMRYLGLREHMDATYNQSTAHLCPAAISAMHAQWVKSDCSTV
jgi:hypothetical protein